MYLELSNAFVFSKLVGVFCVVIVNNLQLKTYAQKVSNVFVFFYFNRVSQYKMYLLYIYQ